jgi:urease accessory protein
MTARLLAIWQSDAAFPTGAFAFSNGLEGVAALKPPLDRAALTPLVQSMLMHRWSSADRVALVHAWRAGSDIEEVVRVDRAYDAATVSEPMRTGSRRHGRALLAVHARLGTAGSIELKSAIAAKRALGHLPIVQGVCWRALGLDERASIEASGYIAVSGFVSAAIRLGGVGAVEGQSVIAAALPVIAAAASDEVTSDQKMISSTPFLDIAAIRQSRADVRLFSN